MPLFDLNSFDKELIPKRIISEKLIRKHHALPLQVKKNQLFIAVSDPTRQIACDEIKFASGLSVSSVVVDADKLNALIEEVLNDQQDAALGDISDADLEELDISSGDEQHESEESDTDDAPIVRFVHKILLDAVNQGASDIHFEPYENMFRARFRLDGILKEVAHPPANLANRITSRLKVMSQLDISERRVPQDGRFKIKLSRNRSVDFRISTCPTVGGEKVVMRILDPSTTKLGIDALGFAPDQKEKFLKAIHKPQGMVLVTGPTGSGKTVTMYTALNILNDSEKNISTAEDPVEIKVEGINQVHINNKTGLTFSAALRSFLRQDPDIIMVGEMRDLETAEIGVKAAQTGHLVLSTLHTNSAPETLTRLANMGVPPFNIATSVSLIIAQRLARKLCEKCKVIEDIPVEVFVEEGFDSNAVSKVEIFGPNPKGCEFCNKGYKGRIGLYEVLVVSKTIEQLIMSGGSAIDMEKTAKDEGMVNLRESGIEKVMAGITSLEEINRVTKD